MMEEKKDSSQDGNKSKTLTEGEMEKWKNGTAEGQSDNRRIEGRKEDIMIEGQKDKITGEKYQKNKRAEG